MSLTLKQVRELACRMCGAPPPNHAHHITGRGKGLGTKNPDDWTIPLCATCHSDLHCLAGMFKNWTRAELTTWQAMQRTMVHESGEAVVSCFACQSSAVAGDTLLHANECPIGWLEREAS